MDNTYVEQYSDVNVEGIEYYVKAEPDGYLYKEVACENKVTAAELKHSFEMSDVVIVDGDYKYRPEVFGVNESGTFVIYSKVVYDNEEEIGFTPTQVFGYEEVVEEETSPETTPETSPETTPETVPPTTGE